jgi:carboxyl-terminal processing protease
MRKAFSLLLILISVHLNTRAQEADSIRILVDSALKIMQTKSAFTKKVDWVKVTDSVRKLSGSAKTYSDAAPALKYAFNSLGDKHGFIVINDTYYRNPNFPFDTARVNADMKSAITKGPRIYGGIVQKKYAYISIPFFMGQTVDKVNAFAQQIQDSLCTVINASTKGVIIDLRINPGGNTFPMLIGVSNVFGNQAPFTKGYTGDWKIEDYGMTMPDSTVVRLKRTCGDYSKLPVAVLIGPQTASAGEYLALGFTVRKNTALIGERTAGYTSGNNGFYLTTDKKNAIVVAEDFAKDINGKLYENGIEPQIEVVGGDNFFNRDKDNKIKAAVDWLNKHQVKR